MVNYVPSNKTDIRKTLIKNWPEDQKDAVYYRLASLVHSKETPFGSEKLVRDVQTRRN